MFHIILWFVSETVEPFDNTKRGDRSLLQWKEVFITSVYNFDFFFLFGPC